jgi:hypothetical protein
LSSTLAILNELQRRGVSVTADGDALVLKPRRAVDGQLLARVCEHKLEIIRALTNRPAMPIPKSAEPIIPTRADCGCPGPVCRRCWLCAEVHCRCLPKTTCWHCGGLGRCGCTACWRRFVGEVAECVMCHGSGKIVEWVE